MSKSSKRGENPYGDLPGCRDGCLCSCGQSGCACHEKAGPFMPTRPDKRVTTP